MNNFGSKIYDLRKKNNMTLEEVGEIVGVGKSTVRKWETGEIANMRRDKIAKLAEALHTTPAYLMGWEEPSVPSAENIIPIPNMTRVPLLGDIACGSPVLATENLSGFVSSPEGSGADFALRCKGDSMIGARILDGDIVLIRQQPDVDDGEIAAVLIDNEATLKRVHRKKNYLILAPANPAYEPIVLTGEELSEVRILGKAVSFISAVK